MVLSCLEQSSSSHIDDEPHAFDLTWRNYLPSVSQFCCCFQKQAIRLDDDDPLIEPIYYNDHTLYRGEALQNYLNNPRDWEFESVLSQNDLPQFVTRNPFGTSKKKTAKKKKRQQRQERPVVMETDLEDGDIHGYDIQEGIEDAEFLADDQIAHLAYNRHSKVTLHSFFSCFCLLNSPLHIYKYTEHGSIRRRYILQSDTRPYHTRDANI